MRFGNAAMAEGDAAFAARLDCVEKQVLAACRPRAYWRLEKIERGENFRMLIGGLETHSRQLAHLLRGCGHAFLFCATLGAEVDALLRRLSRTSAAEALMAQGVAAALVETYCDFCMDDIAQEVAPLGETLTMRFSPGYGDLPLEVQRPLLSILDSQRKAGIVLSQNLLMIPSKSVSAIIGAGAQAVRTAHERGKCNGCAKADCEYRND